MLYLMEIGKNCPLSVSICSYCRKDYVSPGEMQKIAFARLFFHKPSFAVLDEATSSLSEEDEHYFYNILHQMGTTVLSIGHRSTIKQVTCVPLYVTVYQHCLQYHQFLLSLSGQGKWTMESIQYSNNISYVVN